MIAINDHSTDGSQAVIETYQDDRIKVYLNEGHGILTALQTAQKYIKGDFVTRMDADDIMPLFKLKALLEVITSKPTGTIATGIVKYFGSNAISNGYQAYEHWLNKTADHQSFYKRIYRECVVASPNWMMRRLDFETMDGFNKLSYPEDYDMVFQWRKHGFDIKSCHQLTHLWREHPGRTSRNSDNYQQESFFRLKLRYFIEEFHDKSIYLMGTEKKGILTARILEEQKVPFRWFAQDPKLFGEIRHGVAFEDIQSLPSPGVCIVAIYPQMKERTLLKDYVSKKGYTMGDTAHFF